MIPRPRPRLQFNIERTLSWFPPIRAAGKRTEEFITPDFAARFVGYAQTTAPESTRHSRATWPFTAAPSGRQSQRAG
jgi:hypothetical protein